MPKLTLQKRCGNPNCMDPRCPYVIVEKRRTLSDVKKLIKKKSPVNWFSLVGTMIFFFIAMFQVTVLVFGMFIKAQGG